MSEERVTIRQLARLSGVSVGTVSRALNGYADVGPRRASASCASRASSTTRPPPRPAAWSPSARTSIGVFLETGEGHPDLQHPFFHEVLGGLKHAIGAGGYDLLLFASERPGNGYGPHSYLKRRRHHNVDGGVLMGVDPEDPEVRRLVRCELPCVGVDMELERPGDEVVMSDNEGGARPRRAAPARPRAPPDRHHHRHARHAPGRRPPARLPRRDAGLGLAYRDEYVAYGDFYAESGRAGDGRLLALAEPPTAIFAASDMMAIGAIRAAAERRPARPRRPLGRRLRRHPARPPRQPAADHGAPGQARPRRGGRRARSRGSSPATPRRRAAARCPSSSSCAARPRTARRSDRR